MQLPQLAGPCVFREVIPLAWQLDVATANDWEMSRYLQVLADFEQPDDQVDEVAQNAKTDLMLLWLARSLHTQMPPTTSAMIGLEFIAWHALSALPIEQSGHVSFCLSEQFPMLLRLPAQIVACTAAADGFVIKAAWQPMSQRLQDNFEKTIFRYHRRHIHQLREQK